MTSARDNHLHALARNLLGVSDLQALLTLIPDWLAPLFGPQATVCLLLGSPLEPSGIAVPGVAIHRLPLLHGEEPLGVLQVELPAAAWDERQATAAADLLAAAIARERRLAAERQQAAAGVVHVESGLIAMLSHEMRTPLAAIKGYASALLLDQAAWDPLERAEFLHAIDEESDRLTKLITDILDSTAIEAGQLRIEPEPLLLARLVQTAAEKVRRHSDRHRVVISFPPDFPIVFADGRRIEQVLHNLLDNAVKYSPGGGLIVIRGQVRPGEVVVSVADQGVGIAPEHLGRLFERFFRVEPDGRSGVVGSGLGLPISDAIVRAHGGRIWADSTLSRGTTLSFTLPLASLPSPPRAEDA